MKNTNNLPVPPELHYLGRKSSQEHRLDVHSLAREYAQWMKKVLRKAGRENQSDSTEPMLRRRVQVLTDYTEKIVDRYRKIPGHGAEYREKDIESYIHFNFIPFMTYNHMEEQSRLLLAASIWILDEISEDPSKWKQLYQILPRNEEELDDAWDLPNLWHVCYDKDLIASVRYVLYFRNKDVTETEVEGEGTPRILTNSLAAKNAQHRDVPSRRRYEQLISLIPEESVKRAVAYFEDLFHLWTDRYFFCIAPMNIARGKLIEKADALAEEYNRLRAELKETLQGAISGLNPKKPVINPLLAKPPQGIPGLPGKPASNIVAFPGAPGFESNSGNFLQRALMLPDRMMDIADRHSAVMDELDELDEKRVDFVVDLIHRGDIRDHAFKEKYGNEVADRLKPLEITKPFEACFALLWLIENGSDLPWLYGVGCGLMSEVIDCLPWGLYEYRESHDQVWNPEEDGAEQLSFLAEPPKKKKKAKPASFPDWYERKYVPDEDESFRFDRSLAQIVFEETGCILPRNMHKYAGLQKTIRRYGVPGKDVTALLSLFAVLGHARRSATALNLDPDLMAYWDQEAAEEELSRKDGRAESESSRQDAPPTWEELAAKLKEEQENSRKLRASLHEAEKISREARKALEKVRESAELEHRELADLREAVFNAENDNAEEDEDTFDSNLFPYEVIRETVVFGGHESWLKAIRPMLTGNIRFLDRDQNFNVNVIRNADIIWIQTNAISHTQYYRITDAARQYEKPIRYFSHASASKGARQIMESDR